MGQAKGILLIVAGGSVLSPLGFGMGFYAWFLLNHVAVSVDAEPRAFLLLAADIGLAAWLYIAGLAACRSVSTR
jgi:hypothetical protein